MQILQKLRRRKIVVSLTALTFALAYICRINFITASLPVSADGCTDGGTNDSCTDPVVVTKHVVNQTEAYEIWWRHRKEPSVAAYEAAYRELSRGIVIIDNRPVAHYRAALESAIHYTPETWGIYIIISLETDKQTEELRKTTEASIRSLNGISASRSVGVSFLTVSLGYKMKRKNLSARNFGNIVLYQSSTWPQMPVEHIFFLQSDSYVCNSGIEKFVDQHDYIGAPWPHRPYGLNVGNGGSSYRSRSAMVYCNNHAQIKLKKRDGDQKDGVSEDAYFSTCVKRTPWLKGATTEQALLFGMEMVYAPNSLTLHQIHVQKLSQLRLVDVCRRCRGVGQLPGIKKKWLSPAPKELEHCFDAL